MQSSSRDRQGERLTFSNVVSQIAKRFLLAGRDDMCRVVPEPGVRVRICDSVRGSGRAKAEESLRISSSDSLHERLRMQARQGAAIN